MTLNTADGSKEKNLDVETGANGLNPTFSLASSRSNSDLRNGQIESSEEDKEEKHEIPPIEEKSPRWQQILHAQLIPDDCFTKGTTKVFDGPAVVKLLKFILLSFAGIMFVHGFNRWTNRDRDDTFPLSDFWVYESNFVVADTIVFYVIGRLFRQRGIDYLAWILFAALPSVVWSLAGSLEFAQHSLTLYEMHCKWPPGLWIIFILALILLGIVAYLHIRFSVRQGIVLRKLVEILLCACFFLVPFITSNYFHLHHWLIGWFLGMHASYDVWWSRATMAWCWGMYIHGIATWGRDPVLTCGYAYYVSLDQYCPYLQCYIDALQPGEGPTQPPSSNATQPPVVDFSVTPDWRNCSALTYQP